MKVKVESEKVGLKLNIQKTKIIASGPITSWEIDGETVETVSDLFFWAPKSLQMVTVAMKLSCVGPGKSTLPFELRRKAGDCSRVTAGPIERERIQAEGSQGTAYFYSWLKNISNFSKFRLFVARRAGPRGEPGPCFLLVGQRRGRSPFPSACAWERRFLQRGREPSRSSGKTKRKMNTRIFFLLVFFFVCFAFFFFFFRGKIGKVRGKIN